jgi:glutamine amidotransferase
MNTVAIIDYGMSNLDSVFRVVQECGATAKIIDDPRELKSATRIVLPGVGVFAEGMRRLRDRCFEAALKEQVFGNGIPLLGICLGMQMLATRGLEEGDTAGLGFIDGEVVRLEPDGPDTRVPHVGWNEVIFAGNGAPSCPIFEGIASGRDFYFVHSWHLRAKRTDQVVARTPYCGGFVSAVQNGTVYGVQFHPEKSQRIGFQVIRNFLLV